MRDLVGVAAHPHNQPRLAADGKRVERGYGILQPHVATPLPEPDNVTLYHWLFAGQPGIDPYSAASSEVYQDVFGEGTFAGKGLLHVQAMHAVLGGRLPENRILSHDLLEGSMARCAAVTDITVIEDAPFHADVAASRVHRWIRGDWQLLPILLHAGRWRMRAINRWKMLDNLRRSLVAPLSLAALAFALATDAIAPWATLALVAFAFSAGPLMGALAGMAPSRDDIARIHFYRQALADLGRAVASGAWLLAQLLQHALGAADAIGRALYRLFVSRRHLLQWTTAAAAQAAATTSLAALAWKHRRTPIAAVVLWLALLATRTEWPVTASLLCLVWALGPVWTWWVSRPRPRRRIDALSSADRFYLHDIARDTWRLFERCVGPDDRNLPPDNLQTTPSDMVAHRTSPTNIGLYLLASACAHRFGWIGAIEMIERIEATLATLAAMERHRGHFVNWYDTRTAEPLTPLYVSTVDSGNLCTHLIALAQACLAACQAPLATTALQRALALSLARIAALRGAGAAALGGPALAEILALPEPLARIASDASTFAAKLDAAAAELAGVERPPPPNSLRRRRRSSSPGRSPTIWRRCARRCATSPAAPPTRARRRACSPSPRPASASPASPTSAFSSTRSGACSTSAFASPSTSSTAASTTCSPPRRVRTGLWAIAKGDVPAAHWAALGRPFYAVGALAGLRSWSGSMFEYLMPTLVLDEPYGSVLHSAALAAVLEHIAFAREHHVPWGISECAYSASDHTLAYQYAPQGVPRLALRRTPSDELVIAPYATALAAQVAPHRATTNLRRLEQAHARGRFGFIEALDYSPGRQQGAEGVTRVFTFMAHHQGMSIVALANVLLDGAARHWGMADARIEVGGVAAARARAARGAAVARAAREPDRAPAEAAARNVPRNHARHGGDRADPSALERALRGRASRQRRGRQPLGQRQRLARPRRCPARRLRLVLLPALGSPAAARVADPASGTRRRGALPLQLPRRPRRLRRHLARGRGDDDGLGQPGGRHRVPPRRPAQLRRPHARPRADVGVRGHARRSARRRGASGVLEPVRERRMAGAAPGDRVREEAPPADRQGPARGELSGRRRAGGRRGPDPGRPAALARPQPHRKPSAGLVRRAACGRARGRGRACSTPASIRWPRSRCGCRSRPRRRWSSPSAPRRPTTRRPCAR